jgi:hypothetical protein
MSESMDDQLPGFYGPKGGRKAAMAVKGSHLEHQAYWAERQKLPDADKERLRQLARHVENMNFHEAAIINVVRDSRRAGLSWQWLADELGMTKQAAQQKYGRFCR